MFDDNGVYPGPIVSVGSRGKLLMYYSGRSNGERPLYYMSIGLASSTDGGITFDREHLAPIVGRSEFDPWMTSTPWVMRDGERWRMWYLSGFGWNEDPKDPESFYHIKYAESADGFDWNRDGRVCIDLSEGETNIACPTVIKDGDRYRMWYSVSRGVAAYRIGYSESADGITWTRMDDHVGVGPTEGSWDEDNLAYPYVFRHDSRNYLLYSGNGLGLGGIGLAIEE